MNETKSKDNFTVCKECENFINCEPGSPREHVWYNHRCKANPIPKAIDPYDGKLKGIGRNDLGGQYFTDEEYGWCRDKNDGNCADFKPRRKRLFKF